LFLFSGHRQHGAVETGCQSHFLRKGFAPGRTKGHDRGRTCQLALIGVKMSNNINFLANFEGWLLALPRGLEPLFSP
jgi:hypothetical protein